MLYCLISVSWDRLKESIVVVLSSSTDRPTPNDPLNNPILTTGNVRRKEELALQLSESIGGSHAR